MKIQQKDYTRSGKDSRLLSTALLLVLILSLVPISGALAATNVALGKPATQSSIYSDGTANQPTADRAVDGNTDGRWTGYSVSATAYEADPWWQVDLQAEYEIGGIDIWSYTVGGNPSSEICGKDVLFSQDGVTWTKFQIPSWPPILTHHFSVNAVARYVKVTKQGSARIFMAEVQVWTNEPPAAVDDSYTMVANTALTISAPGVLGNDTEPDGGTLTAAKASDPANGTLILNTDGSFTYTPNTDFSGTDSFTYTANDGLADSNTATVTITVNPNQAPVAVDDSYATELNTPLDVPAPGVLANDTDPDGGTLTVVSYTDPSHGDLTLYTSGHMIYTPNTDFNGVDSFTYTATDGNANSNTVTVTIAVGPNTAPAAENDSYTTILNTPLTISAPGVLGNDTDAESNPLTAAKASDPANGTVTLNTDGSFTYTPNTDHTGSDSFTYTANDGQADSNTATVTITVNPNQAPVAVEDSYTTDHNTPLTITAPGVLANDTDPDGGTLKIATFIRPSNGTLTLYVSGGFTYTPNTGYSGSDTFKYTATDGQADSNTVTVTITVKPAPNTAPVAVNDSYTTDQDKALAISAPGVLGNDTDADDDTLTAIKVSDPANGTVALNTDGSFTYTPNAGYSGSDSFIYTANDSQDDSDTATVTITVNPNTAPVAANDSYTTDYYTPLTISAPGVLGNDTDAESDPLTAKKTGDPANGTVTFNTDGSFTYTPNMGYSGSDSFTYTANDGKADSDAATVEIEVKAPAGDAELLGHWKFDDGSGTAASDSSIYNNTGTLSTGASFSTDNKAPIDDNPASLSVDGTAGKVTVPNSAINRLTNNFTLMGWIKSDTVDGYQFMIATDGANSSNGLSFGLFNDKLLMYTNGAGGGLRWLDKKVVKAGQWSHIAAVMDGNNDVSFYVNGLFVGKVEGDSPATPDTDDNLLIGCDASSRYFDGLIDDVRVYNRALSASEIADKVGLPPCSEIVLHTQVMLGEDSGTIELDGSCTYTLTSVTNATYGGSGLYISSATTIEGNGATIERGTDAPNFRIMRISASVAPTIRDLTLRNGNVADFGGGLRAGGDVTLENVRFENNNVGTYSGGALRVDGKLTVDRCAFLGNQAGFGGAIRHYGATGRITNSVFADNLVSTSGAAIRSSGTTGSLTLLNNSFTNGHMNEKEAICVNGPVTMKNNIFNNFNTGLIASGADAVVNEDYNLFASVGVRQLATDDGMVNSGGHSRIAASPRFVDAGAKNYRLKVNSPAIDLGTDAGLTIDADKNTRPYGPTADIGAYEYQGTGIPSISITKKGPPFAAGTGQTQFVLTVINESANTLDDLRIVDHLPAGATYVTDSASDGGTLNNGVLTWNLAPLAPNKAKRVWYQVTASQDLFSDNYSVASISNPAITDSGTAITTPYKATATALGFAPFPDGYSFANYGGPTLDSDITAADMPKIYGPEVCNEGNSPCVLSAAAEAERKVLASKSSGGHCGGMAMSSMYIYDRSDISPDMYEPGAINTFDITKSNARNLISFFHSTQIKDPADQSGLEPYTVAEGAKAVVDKLIQNFADPNADNRYTLWFFIPGSGHAVVPYAVDKKSADDYWIYVYDVNYPNNYDRVFKIKYSTQEWVYEGAAINPDAPASAWRGDTTDLDGIRLKSLRWAERFPKECFAACESETGVDAANESSSAYHFDLEGEASLMITRDDGLRAGVDPATGEFIAEIPGAEEIHDPAGLLNFPSDIRIPHEAGRTYSLSIADRPTAYGNRTANADLNILGNGFVTRLTGLRIDSPEDPDAVPAGTNDVLGVTFDGDNHSLTFQASTLDNDMPDLSMAVSREGLPDYTFEVIGAELAAGRSMSVAIDVETGKLTIVNDDPAENGYSLDVERLDTDNTKTSYSFAAISDEGGDDDQHIDLGESWTGGAPTITHGEPVEGDLNADGVLDAADYALIRSALGKCAGDDGFIQAADYDGDGCVTYSDYRIWYGYYRNS